MHKRGIFLLALLLLALLHFYSANVSKAEFVGTTDKNFGTSEISPSARPELFYFYNLTSNQWDIPYIIKSKDLPTEYEILIRNVYNYTKYSINNNTKGLELGSSHKPSALVDRALFYAQYWDGLTWKIGRAHV